MSEITMKQLLESGVHFGHQTNRWDPKMKPYIYGARSGIYIIDLQKTLVRFQEAEKVVRDMARAGARVDCRRSHSLRNVLHQPKMVGWNIDKLYHHSQKHCPVARVGEDG